MKAYAIDGYKAPLTLHDMPEPVAGPGEVVIEIAAASVNPLDVKVRSGDFKLIKPYPMPLVLGHDLAGTVVAVGPGANRFKIGDAVYACAFNGAIGSFAERIAIAEADVAAAPSSLAMNEAAALPLVALTAWQLLVESAGIRPGQRVLIHAGSGGVGTIAIQLAKHLGATVATTVGTDNIALAKSLGADIVVDYRQEAFEKSLRDYDLVICPMGGHVLERSLEVLKPGGKLISLSGPPDPAFTRRIGANWLVRQVVGLASFGIRRKARLRGVEYSFFMMRGDGAILQEIATLVDGGKIVPVIDSSFAFDQTPAALERSASGRARGKVVIEVGAGASG